MCIFLMKYGIDQENQKLFFRCIKDLENKKKTIIISTHYPKEYIDFIDNLYLVKEGQINEYAKDQFKVN